MKKRSALYAGILSGLAAPVAAFQTTPYPRLQDPDLARIRKDVVRVGLDFSKVIAREHGKTNVKSK